MPLRLSLALLGPFDIRLDGQPVEGFEYNKVRALLAYLAVEAGQAHTRSHLCALLWPDSPERAARQSLSQALTRLRHTLGDAERAEPLILANAESLQLNPAAQVEADLTRYEALIAASEAHAPRHRGWHLCTPCAGRLAQAAALYRGDFLAQFFVNDSAPFEEWALVQRERQRQRMLSVLERLAAYAEWRGAYDRAAEYARRQVDLEPLLEVNHRSAIRRLALARQATAALAQYQSLRRLLATELGVEPEPETRQLAEQILAGSFPGPGDAEHRVWPLPLPSTRLIGREQAMQAVLEHLQADGTRALTITGPPGIGKTRLALEIAHSLRYDFEEGACFVELAPVSEAAQVPAAVAQALGLHEAPGRALTDTLQSALQTRHLLLVLDNFEHVPEAAGFVAGLLAACPGLKVLATSRAPLHIRAEQQFALAPLALPDADDPPEVMAGAPAMALFVERARSVRPSFDLTPEDLGPVLGLCAQLDGLPLAIELIAARAKTFAPAALLRQLQHGLGAMAEGPRDLPERQRTLSRSIAWSYDRLSPEAQQVFDALGVFTGGCAPEAVQAVAGVDTATLPALEALAETSLIQAQPTTRGARLSMLETLRAFALEQLTARGEVAAAQRRHAAYYSTLAERIEPELVGPEQKTWFGELELELANLRAALSWGAAVGDPAALENNLRLAAALEQFWEVRGQPWEGRRWLEAALEAPVTLAPAVRAKALRAAGRVAQRMGDLRASETLLLESLRLYAQMNDPLGRARAMGVLGITLSRLGNAAVAQAYLTEALELAQEADDNYVLASIYNALAENAGRHGDEPLGRQFTEQALALNRARGDPRNTAGLLLNLGLSYYDGGDFAQAQEHIEASLAAARELDDHQLVALCLLNLGSTLVELHQPAEAKLRYEEALARYRAQHNEQSADSAYGGLGRALADLGDLAGARRMQQQALRLRVEADEPRTVAVSLSNLARLDHQEQCHARAARLLGAAAAIRAAIGSPITSGNRGEHQRLLEGVRAALGDEAFEAAWAEGSALAPAEAVALALGD